MNAESKVTPQKTRTPLLPVILAGTLLGLAGLGLAAMVFFFNPSTHGFYPVCMFHKLTGLNCPGCGMTRASYALLHGNVLLALKDNALFVAMLAVGGVWGGRRAVRSLRNQPVSWKIPPNVLWLLLGLAIFFAVLRNLPGFEWLSP